ncbi:MAG: alpha/beta fold hydrolase [Anaerolineae bacterium]|nr:alpha/beta fold hydrolase [Anaerolineae bacterium]
MEHAYTEKVYTVGGQPIHAVEAGRPGRQVAILIHGWSSSWYAVSPLLGLLAQRFHCIAVDLPGYGSSPPMNEPATIPGYADLIAGLIEQVSTGPVVLVGHSMGGMISITLSIKHPVLVERMVLLSPTINGRLSNSINLFISPITLMERFRPGSLLVNSVERTIVGLTDRLMRPVSFADRTGITAEDYKRIRSDARRPGQGRVRAECFWAMRDNDLSGQLSAVDTPALIVWGAEDNTVPLRDAGIVADEWPEADLRILPKAGHWPQFETTETTRRMIAAYLGLPRHSSELYEPVEEDELVQVREVAEFLAHSDIGNKLNVAQRTRLAAQFNKKNFRRGQTVVHASHAGEELYIIKEGTIEVWKDPEGIDPALHQHAQMQHITTFRPGQIVGEMAMLDQGARTADLIAGEDNTVLLTLNRERLLTLCEDDAVLGTQLLWNIATVMSRRQRFILWQLNRAEEKRMALIPADPQETILAPGLVPISLHYEAMA